MPLTYGRWGNVARRGGYGKVAIETMSACLLSLDLRAALLYAGDSFCCSLSVLVVFVVFVVLVVGRLSVRRITLGFGVNLRKYYGCH